MTTTSHRLALAGLAIAAAGAAHAQGSSVEISGQLGAGATSLNHQTGGGSLKLLNDNLIATSYLRFGGTEDMGGGVAALFRLEAGVGLDTGAAGGNGAGGAKFWNRQSWVGLRSGNLGVVTLGRQFHAASDRALRTFDVYNLAGSSLHVVPLALFGVNRFSGNDTRADNSVKFRTAVPGVLDFGVSVAAGEGTSGRSYSTDLAHGGTNYEVGVFYVHYDAATRVAATGLLPEHEVLGIGGNVTLGPVRPYLAYYDSSLDSTVAGRLTQKNKIIAAGINWTVLPLVNLKAAYYDDKGTSLNGIAGRDGKKRTFVVSGQYFLSKRTELYAAAFQNRFSDGYKLEAVNLAALNRNPAASSVNGYSAGIRHSF